MERGNNYYEEPLNTTQELDSRFELTSNPVLENALRAISSTQTIHWDKIAEIAKALQIQNPENFLGLSAELHTRHILSRTPKILLDPIADDIDTDNFYFKRGKKDNFYVVNRAKGEQIAEYDILAIADKLPVLFEVKATTKYDTSKFGIKNAMREEAIKRRLLPLQEYFRSDDFGYVVVTFPNIVTPNSIVKKNFISLGGKHTILHCSLNKFKQRAEETRIKYGL